MTAAYLPSVQATFFDSAGDPLSNGLIYTYSAGTSTPKTTYSDYAGATPNANPIVLNAAGRAPTSIYLTTGEYYKIVVKNSSGVLQYERDNVTGDGDFGSAITDLLTDVLALQAKQILSVSDFNAPTSGGTDATAAFQAAITYMEANNVQSLFVPFGAGQTYNLVSSVNISRGNIVIWGDGGPLNRIDQGGYIYSTTTNAVLFNWKSLVVPDSSALSMHHLNFKGTYVGGSNEMVVLKATTTDNGPSRPAVFESCSVWGFYAAVQVDNATGGLGPGFWSMSKNDIRRGRYAFLATDRVQGLHFYDNVAEDGASIAGQVICWAHIHDNLLESSIDTIDISSQDGASVRIYHNYFEENSGDFLMRVGGYTGTSNAVFHLGFFYKGNSLVTDDTVTIPGYVVRGQACVHLENWGNGQVNYLFNAGELLANSEGIYRGYSVGVGGASGDACSTLRAGDFLGQKIAATLRKLDMGTVEAWTPHGRSETCLTISTFSTTAGPYTISKSGSTGDLIVFNVLVRSDEVAIVTDWANSVIQLHDQTDLVLLGEVAFDITQQWQQDWYLMTIASFARADFTSVRCRFTPYSPVGGSPAGTPTGITIAGVSGEVYNDPEQYPLVRPIYPIEP